MKKLLNKKGFTLMEMLIVVAIIVILVAISIPTFSNSLDSAKQATDAANLRSAKSAYVMQTMADAGDDKIESSEKYYYDYKEGKFKTYTDEANIPTESKGECKNHEGDYITIVSGTAVWSDTSHRDACK